MQLPNRPLAYLLSLLMLVSALSTVATTSSRAAGGIELPPLGHVQHNFTVPYEVDQSWIRRDMKFVGLNDPVDFWMFNAIFPVCKQATQQACVESVLERQKGSEQWRELEYVRDLVYPVTTSRNSAGQLIDFGPFVGRPENLLPDGGSPSIWSSARGLLRVSVGIDGGMRNGSSWNTMARMSVSGLGWNLSESTEYKLVLRMGVFLKSVQGFLQGHLSNPEVLLLEKFPRGRISISGSPVTVTEVSAINKFQDLTSEMLESLDGGGFEYNQGLAGKQYVRPRDWTETTPSKVLNIASDNHYGLYAPLREIAWFRDLEPFFVKQSLRDVTLWRVRTPWAWDKNRNCYQEDPDGPGFRAVISTNATVYEVELPELDENDSFKIHVGSPSLDASGKRKFGSYFLAIEEVLAKCLWKRDLLPARVELKISYTDGREEISTLSVSRRAGFLYLSTAGFGFSSPRLTFRLPRQERSVQEESVSVAESMGKQGSKEVMASKPKGIQCKRGQEVRSVAKKKKCPKGYKRV